MLKKILIGLGIFIALIIVAAIAVPIIFKDDIAAVVKKETNKAVNAKVDFGEFELSILRSFPNFYFQINDVLVENKAPFEGTTLAQIKSFDFTVDLISILKGNIKVIGVNIVEPIAHVKVLKDGTANWDVALKTDSVATDTSAAATEFEVALQKFTIKDGNIIYDDASLPLYTEIKNLDYTMKGDFTQSVFDLDNEMEIEALTLIFDDVKYLNNVHSTFDAKLKVNLDSAKYEFDENELTVNALALKFNGWVTMPNEDINMDVNFETNKPSIATVLSLVPGVYTKDINDVKASGEMGLAGYAKGTFNETTYPAFGINMFVDNGKVQYPDLPTAINNINLNLLVNNPGGDLNNMVVEMPKMHFELGQEPFDMTLFLKTPIVDPFIDMTAKGNINLGRFQEAIPLEDVEGMSGNIDVDIKAKGNYSSIEKEQYQDFMLAGILGVKDLNYKATDLPNVKVNNMQMSFNPKTVVVSDLNMILGQKSDVIANGTINNMVAYVLVDSTLSGSMNVASNYFNANEWIAAEEAPAGGQSTNNEVAEPLTVFEVPSGINFVLNADMQNVLYDNMELSNIKGTVVVKNEEVKINQTTLNLLGGDIAMAGLYSTNTEERKKQPYFDFDMSLLNMDIQKSFTTFNTVQLLAPVAKASEGTFNTKLKIEGNLGEDMLPVYPTLFGIGDCWLKI